MIAGVTAAWAVLAAAALVRARQCRRATTRLESGSRSSRFGIGVRPRFHIDVLFGTRRPLRRLGVLVSALVLAGLVAPAAGIGLLAASGIAVVAKHRRAHRRERDEIDAEVAWCADALGIAVSSGLNLRLATEAVARRASGPVAEALDHALLQAAHGTRLADAFDAVVVNRCEGLRPLVAVLTHSERYGSPLGESLSRLGYELRLNRRRRAEESARQIPVKLLFPLVVCILPSFGLLTVAPLIASGLGSLRL